MIAFRFPPQGGGGVQRSSKLIKYLSREGVVCEVITGPITWSEIDPTLLEDVPSEVERSSVNVFPWRRWLQRRRDRSRLWIVRQLSRIALWLIVHTLAPDLNTDWFLPAVREGNRRIRKRRPDVILVSGPPWTPFLVARYLSLRHRIPLVLDYRDPWTRTYLPTEKPVAARLLSPWLERWVLRGASGVIGAHRAILERLRPITPRRVPCLWAPNGFDPEDFTAPRADAAAGSRFEFLLTYTGSFFERRLPRVLLEVLDELLASGEIDGGRFRFRHAGGSGPLRRILEGTPHLSRCFQWVGYVQHTESLALLHSSNVNLVFESDDPEKNRTTPGKFYEVARAGRPVLLLCPRGVTTHLAERIGGCRVAAPNDRDRIREEILAYYRAWEAGVEPAGPDPKRLRFYSRTHQAARVQRFLRARSSRRAERAAARKGLTRLAAWNALSAAVGRFAGMLVSIVLTPIVLGELGRALYGVMATAGSLFDYLTLLRGGLGSALRRHVTIRLHSKRTEEARAYYQTGFWLGALLRVPILIAILFAAEPLCRFVRLPESYYSDAVPGVLLILLAAWLGDIATIFAVPTYATGNTGLLSAFQMSIVVLRLAFVVVAFELFPPSLRVYGGVLVVLMTLLILGQAGLAHRSRSVGPIVPRFSMGTPQIRKDLFSYGGLSIMEQIGVLLWLTGDNLLVGRFYGAEQVTFYSLGARWMPLIQSFATTVFRSVQPLFTQLEAQADEKKTIQATLLAISISSVIAVPACLVPCVVGDLFLTHWVGAEYTGAYTILLVTLLPLTLDIALAPIWIVLSAHGRIGWVAGAELFLAVARMALGVALALGAGMGVLGFATGSAIALLVRALILRTFTVSRFSWLPPGTAMLVRVGKALLGGAPGLLLLAATRDLYGHSMATLIVAGGIGAALTAAGSALLVLGRTEIRRLSRALIDPSRPSIGGAETERSLTVD